MLPQYIKNIIIKCKKEICNINIFLTRKHEKQSISYNSYGSYIYESTHLENSLLYMLRGKKYQSNKNDQYWDF